LQDDVEVVTHVGEEALLGDHQAAKMSLCVELRADGREVVGQVDDLLPACCLQVLC
jgi:hypothetical protein